VRTGTRYFRDVEQAFEDALAAGVLEYAMYMGSVVGTGRVFDEFKHRESRLYLKNVRNGADPSKDKLYHEEKE